MQPDQTRLSTDEIFGVLRRRAIWILVCTLVVGGVAYGLSKRQPKKYTATAAVEFGANPIGLQIAGLSPSNSAGVLAQQNNNVELLRVGATALRTATLLGDGVTAATVAASVSIGAQGETNIVDVSATAASPSLAAGIANTYVRQFVREQQRARRRYVNSALALVNRQLAQLTPAQRAGADGLDLQSRAHTLSLLAGLGYENVAVAGEAAIPTEPSSPRSKRNTILGLLLGLAIGLGLAFVLERYDRRIWRPQDLEAIYGLPLLGIVPKSAALARTAEERVEGAIELAAADSEAFGLIRAHLRLLNADREIRTVLIASPSQGDGKTMMARHTAEAAARSGASVLLVEADLRHPVLARRLGLDRGVGLADVLVGSASMDDAVRSVDLRNDTVVGEAVHKLAVLTAGLAPAESPAELLESDAMIGLLARARSSYDLVVIDTPPLTAVADGFPLLTRVDGVVLVGRVGHSRRDEAESVSHLLVGSNAPLLGVVANDAQSGGPSPYPRATTASDSFTSQPGPSPDERAVAAK